MTLSSKQLERAIARKVSNDAEAAPRATEILAKLRGSPCGDYRPECPQSGSDLPDCWPYRFIETDRGRCLLWACEALPEKASELQALCS